MVTKDEEFRIIIYNYVKHMLFNLIAIRDRRHEMMACLNHIICIQLTLRRIYWKLLLNF